MSVEPIRAAARTYFSPLENSGAARGVSSAVASSSAHHTKISFGPGGMSASSGGYGGLSPELAQLLSSAGGYGALASGAALTASQSELLASAGGYAGNNGEMAEVISGFTSEYFPVVPRQKKWYEMISEDSAPKWYELLAKIPLPKWYEMPRSETPAWYQTLLSTS